MRLLVISLQVTDDHEALGSRRGKCPHWHPVKTVVCKKAEFGGRHGPEALLAFETLKFRLGPLWVCT